MNSGQYQDQPQAFNDHPNDNNVAADQNQSGANSGANNGGQSKGKSLLQKILPGKHGNNNDVNTNTATHHGATDQNTATGNWDGQRYAQQGAGTGVSGLEQDRMENNLRGPDRGLGAYDDGMGVSRTAGGNAPVDGMNANRTTGGNVGQNWDNSDTTGHKNHRGRHVAEGAVAVGTASVGEHEWREHERRKEQGQTNTGGNWDDTQGQGLGQGQTYDQGVTGGHHDHRGRHVVEGAGAAAVGEHEWKEHERRQGQQGAGTGVGTGTGQGWDQGNTTGHHDHRGRYIAEGAGAAAVGDHEWRKHEGRQDQQGIQGTGTGQGLDQNITTGHHDHRGRHIAEGAGAAAIGDHELREHDRHHGQHANLAQQPGFVPGQTQAGVGANANQYDTYPGNTTGTTGGLAGVNQNIGGNTATGYSAGTSVAPDGGIQDSGHGGIIAGKLEQAAGVLLGNEGMKTRGQMKEQEAMRTRDARYTQPGQTNQGTQRY